MYLLYIYIHTHCVVCLCKVLFCVFNLPRPLYLRGLPFLGSFAATCGRSIKVRITVWGLRYWSLVARHHLLDRLDAKSYGPVQKPLEENPPHETPSLHGLPQTSRLNSRLWCSRGFGEFQGYTDLGW